MRLLLENMLIGIRNNKIIVWLKSLVIAIMAAAINFGGTFIQGFRPERCTGVCGSCGGLCVAPVAGFIGLGVLVSLIKKHKKSYKNHRSTV